MKKIDHNFKKKYGQNFLKDNLLIKKIVDYIPLGFNDLVIEIGPGSGAMTKELVKRCKVIAYEIDFDLKDTLLNEVKSDNLQVIWDDFLKRNIKEDISEIDFRNLYVIANLPYYITTPIITKLIESNLQIENILIMVQKEVAERFSASPGSREYGSITVYLNYYFKIKKVFNVSRNLFFPKPNVDSAVISLESKKEKMHVSDESRFINFVRDCFRFKRKTIKNNLKNYDLISAESILKKYGLDLNVRAESLTLEIFVDLFNNI